MSCGRMENKILEYVDGRLKESERLEVEKHLAACPACRLRVNEFRAVSGLLDELPMIEPSAAFDLRVHARVAAEPVKQSWWAWFMPAPRDRKSTRLNSSHVSSSYAVFCLKKK